LQPVTKSDPTIFFGIPGQLPPEVKVGKPKGSNENIHFPGNTATFDFSHSGKDPITPAFDNSFYIGPMPGFQLQ
jgi:hypothetical protein